MANGENKNGNGNWKNGHTISEKQKYKFLFVSWESLSGDLAWQIKKEGHLVKVYIKADYDKDVYNGFLEKVDDYWKISDFINEKGELLSGTDELTTKKQEDSKLIQEDKQTINEIKSQVQALKLSQEQAKSEPKQTLYNMNQDILVDYLSYKVTKVETFKEMGTSIYNKKTEGKLWFV